MLLQQILLLFVPVYIVVYGGGLLNAPLHFGGTVVRENAVYRSACFARGVQSFEKEIKRALTDIGLKQANALGGVLKYNGFKPALVRTSIGWGTPNYSNYF